MRVLFIGGTGNISAHCAALLRARGDTVFVLSRGRNAIPKAYHAICGDRSNLDDLRRAATEARPDVIINFLGYTVADVGLDFKAFSGAAAQYIFISTTAVYQKPPPILPITENTPRGNEFWDYASRKVDCEQLLEQLRDSSGFPVTIARPSHTYSERWVPNAISSASYTFARRLEQGRPVFVHDDGKGLWTLTHARDFAHGLAGLAGNEQAIGESFHITADTPLDWREIYSEIAFALGVSEPQIIGIPTEFICATAPRFSETLRGDKAHPGVFDNSKIKRFVPNFACATNLRDGLRESVGWLRQHPEAWNLNAELDADIDLVLQRWGARRAEAS